MISIRKKIFIVLTSVLISLTVGCSENPIDSAINPVQPALKITKTQLKARAHTAHSLMGLYECKVNPEEGNIEVIPLRDSMFHLNALRFLEPPPPVLIKLFNFSYNGSKIDVDVQLTHPFAGLEKYTGFDVCGIVISSGSISGFSDPHIVIAGEGDTRLVNPDGLTRWWNPREFPYNNSVPMWGYINGGWGTKDEVAKFSATINGYKYFAHGLNATDSPANLDLSMRGAFLAGSSNTRHYEIELDGGLIFNYAIDASWLPPTETPVIVPDSFPSGANREEPYFLSSQVVSNTLFFDPTTGLGGGQLQLNIKCYDWFNADSNTIRIESPGNFDPVVSNNVIGGTAVYSTYYVEISGNKLVSSNPITLFVSAESGMDYDGLLPGKAVATYMPPFKVSVSELQTGEIVLVWGDEGYIDHPFRVPYNDIEPALIVNGNGELLCSFFYWTQISSNTWVNYPLFATSLDKGYTFGEAGTGFWQWHSIIGDSPEICWNGKYTLGSNGHAFHSYYAPCGHTLQSTPKLANYVEAGSHSGPEMKHAGEMLYTAEGYPMMFGDYGGQIFMRRGDYPNIASTMTWPVYQGTHYSLVPPPNNWLSLARSAGKTSDGRCHLIFWNNGSLDYIQIVSSTDISGKSWEAPVVVFNGLAEIWDGAQDPSLWIDKNDGFHTSFCAWEWTGKFHLMYGYSPDGKTWSDSSHISVEIFQPDKMPHDTHVIVFDAFDETYVFLGYEVAGKVWCRYKKLSEQSFSDPIQVNLHPNALLPDMYPNGGTGVIFAYQADDGSGQNLTDIFYRVAEFKKK